jgi:L-lactate utilization protein LutB
VKINIPKHLINLRRDIVSRELSHPLERLIYRAWAWTQGSTTLYNLVALAQRIELRRRAGRGDFVHKLPFPGSGWTDVRPIPKPAARSFRSMWSSKRN